MLMILTMIIPALLSGTLVYLILRNRNKKMIKEESVILLERVKKVCKLITVEGDFSDIYDYHEQKKIMFGLIPQNKRMLLIIKARAYVGIDLSEAKFTVDKHDKKITITRIPEPKLISLETDVKYYDIQQSMFNKFSTDDHTTVNRNAKESIMQQVQNSSLPESAKKQSGEILTLVLDIIDIAGWQLIVDDTTYLTD